MGSPRTRAARLAVSAALLTLACLAEKVVVPGAPLAAVIARDKPVVQLVQFELGRKIAADTVTISNNGDAPLGAVRIESIEYVAGGRRDWLAASLVARGDGALLILTPTYRDAAGAPPDVAMVTLRADGAPEKATVEVVARTIPGARFEFSVDPVTYVTIVGESRELEQELSVRNGGNDTLRIRDPRVAHPRAAAPWLRATRGAGADSTAARFTLTASTAGLAAGIDTALVIFESSPSEVVRAHPDTVVVLIRVGQPRLGASSALVGFTGVRGGEPVPAQPVLLSNVGDGTTSSLGQLALGAPAYRTGDPTGWLTATLDQGSVLLRASTGALGEGVYQASLPVASEHGGSITLVATLAVRLPGLTLSPGTVSFNGVEGGSGGGTRVVAISNSGSGTLATLGALTAGPPVFDPGQPDGWLGASLADSTVTLTASVGALAAGTYGAKVRVSSGNGGAEDIRVALTVARATDPPVLSVSAARVAFAGTRGDPDPAPQRVALTNTGGGSLGALSLGPVTSAGGWLGATIAGSDLVLSAAVGSMGKQTTTGTVEVRSANGGSRSIVADLTVGVPVLTLSSSATAFSATQGGPPTPGSHAVVISNTGSGSWASLGAVSLGTVAYGAGQPTGWLTATRTDSVITLTATTGPLPAGLYSATVPVSSANGGSASLGVRFSVAAAAAQPMLALGSQAIGLAAVAGSTAPVSQGVTYFNSGGGLDSDLGPVSASVPAGAAWLTRAIGAGAITFTADPTGLAAGSYTTTVPVSASPGGTSSVAVTLTVAAADQPAALALSSRSVSFAATAGAANPASQTVALSNAGGGGLPALGTLSRGAIAYGPGAGGWLTTAALNAGSGVLTLQPETGALAAGTYEATVPVSASAAASGSPDQITVSFTVAPMHGGGAAMMALSAATASFAATGGGGSPASQKIDVFNSGAGGLAALGTLAIASVTYGPGATGWLTTATVSPSGEVSLRPTTGTLPPATYDAVVTVTASAPNVGSPRTITVRFTVAPPPAGPELTLSSGRAGFATNQGGPNPPQQTVTVSNTGGGSLGTLSLGAVTYVPSASGGWLTRALTGSAVQLQPQTGALAPGTYRASFAVTASAPGVGGNPATLTVDFTVAPNPAPPVLTLGSEAASFAAPAGSNPASQAVAAVNTGGGDLASLGTVAAGPIAFGAGASGWLTASVHQTTKVITLTPAAATVGVGQFTATVPVTSTNGGTASIAATLSIAAPNSPPRLEVSLGSLTFRAVRGGADPAPQQVTVSNAGGGTLAGVGVRSVTYSGPAGGWLAHQTSDPTVTFTAAAAALPAGLHNASATIGSDNGGSRTVAVTLEIKTPILTLSAKSVSFGASQDDADPPPPQTLTIANTGVGTLASLGAVSLGAPVHEFGEPAGWLVASIAGPTVSLRTATGTLPSGSYTARLPISSQFGGAETVVVTLTVAPGAAPPVLALSAGSVDFTATRGGGDPPAQAITITNGGGQTLGSIAVVVPPDAGWLRAAIQGRQAVFSAVSQGLEAGEYTAVASIVTGNAGTERVAVRLVVGAPRLALSSRAVTFGDTVGGTRSLRSDVFITNSGVGDLAALGVLTLGTVSHGAGEPTGWLLEPVGDRILSEAAVRLEARVGGLPEGGYTARIPVRSTAGGQDTITVRVSVNRPDPALDRPSIEFALDGEPVTSVAATRARGDTTQFAVRVAVRNPTNTAIALTGLRVGATVYVNGPAQGWVTGAFLDKTSAPFGSPAELLVAIAPRGLAAGRYEADVPISSSAARNSPVSLRVVLLIQ